MAHGKILYLGINYHPAIGGAEVTDQLLLEAWVAQGGAAMALYRGSGPRVQLRGVEAQPVPDADRMMEEARAFGPDLIYSQVGTHIQGLELSRSLGVPVMTCLHDARPLCPDLVAQVHCDRYCPLCPHYLEAPVFRTKAVLRHFDRILAPSQYMVDLANRLLDRTDASVLYPAVRPLELAENREASVVSMATAELIKGADIFLQIAERMPDLRFRLAGRGNARRCGYDPARHPNVEVAETLPQEQFYGDSWLVLMPSRWAEPFGRMAPEAQSAGILFMGSRVGGLPEAGGEAGIFVDRHLDPDAWVEEIRRLQGDPERQRHLRELGRSSWRRFDAEGLTRQFVEWSQELIDHPKSTVQAAPVPLDPIPSPWPVAPWMRWTYLLALAAATAGSLLGALGLGLWLLWGPAIVLLAILILLWGFHAGPLLQQGAKAARRSGIKSLRVASGLVVLTPLAGLSPVLPWIVFAGLLLLQVATFNHVKRARLERSRLQGR